MLQSLIFPKDEVGYVTYQLIKLLNLHISESSILRSVEEHPNYPSILCISDSLRKFGVGSFTAKVKAERLDQIKVPFIAQVKLSKSENIIGTHASDAGETSLHFVAVKPTNDNRIEYFDPKKTEWRKVMVSDFHSIYNGFVLVPDAKQNAGEKNYKIIRKIEFRKKVLQNFLVFAVPIAICVLILSKLLNNDMQDYFEASVMFLNGAGAMLCALLVKFELEEDNSSTKNICIAKGKVNCNAVLKSKYSKIFDIPWSVIGFSYFLGSTVLCITVRPPYLILSILAWSNIVSILFVIFSVFYQKFVLKMWCSLCLWVQAILILLAALQIIYGDFATTLPDKYIIEASLFLYLLVFVAALKVVNLLKLESDGRDSKRRLHKILGDSDVFQALLANQKTIQNNSDEIGILLGSESAKYKITKVSSPYCGPCSKSHMALEDLLEVSSDVSLRVIFLSSSDPDVLNNSPVVHFLEMYEKRDQKGLREAMIDWYGAEVKDYDKFSRKYPLQSRSKYDKKIDEMRDWCTKNEIAFTPTIFYNGYQLPPIYSSGDLAMFSY